MTDGNADSRAGRTLLWMYRTMVTIRHFEEEVRTMHLAGLAPGLVHLCSGQEAVAAGVCAALDADDYIASHHRGHGHCIAKGARLERLFAEILGRRLGYGMGRGGSMHILDPETRNLGTNGIVGGGVPLAAGAGLSARILGNGRVAVSFFGDGVLNQGLLFESMNMAAIWKLPVLFVCENNCYGEFTRIDSVTAGAAYTARGDAFDIPTMAVDGMDALAVNRAAMEAIRRAREGGGPTFLVCDTYRFTGHHVGDAQHYKDDEEQASWRKRDPIPKLSRRLVRDKVATKKYLQNLEAEITESVRAAADAARAIPAPEAGDFGTHVYAE